VGPEHGKRHRVMLFGDYKQRLPNYREYSVPLLKKLLKQVQQGLGRQEPITPDEWEGL